MAALNGRIEVDGDQEESEPTVQVTCGRLYLPARSESVSAAARCISLHFGH
jgi:hypothetical protein